MIDIKCSQLLTNLTRKLENTLLILEYTYTHIHFTKKNSNTFYTIYNGFTVVVSYERQHPSMWEITFKISEPNNENIYSREFLAYELGTMDYLVQKFDEHFYFKDLRNELEVITMRYYKDEQPS